MKTTKQTIDIANTEVSKSSLALKLQKLKDISLKLVATRERLPQPLFWSLFQHKINEIRDDRKQSRNKRAELYNCEWLKS